MRLSDIKPGAKIVARHRLPYGIVGEGEHFIEIRHVLPGTRGTILETGKYTTTVAFAGHEQHYHCDTHAATFALTNAND